MPTVLLSDGFRFVIWPADHEPPHVHVFKGDGEAKVHLGSKGELPSFVTIEGMTRAEARKVWKMAVEHQKALLQAWEKIHGNTDHQ